MFLPEAVIFGMKEVYNDMHGHPEDSTVQPDVEGSEHTPPA